MIKDLGQAAGRSQTKQPGQARAGRWRPSTAAVTTVTITERTLRRMPHLPGRDLRCLLTGIFILCFIVGIIGGI